MQKQKIQLDRTNELDLTFFYFGMDHPSSAAIRRKRWRCAARSRSPSILTRRSARSIAGRRSPRNRPCRAGLRRRSGPSGPLAEFNPRRAKALLDVYGYVDRTVTGIGESPDGRSSCSKWPPRPTAKASSSTSCWHKFMESVGLRTSSGKAKWPEHLRDSRAGKLMI